MTIPEQNNNIYIYGEVNQSGVYAYKNTAELEYYIDVAGGFKDYADTEVYMSCCPMEIQKSYQFQKTFFQINQLTQSCILAL